MSARYYYRRRRSWRRRRGYSKRLVREVAREIAGDVISQLSQKKSIPSVVENLVGLILEALPDYKDDRKNAYARAVAVGYCAGLLKQSLQNRAKSQPQPEEKSKKAK